jgi:hypothetical protein
MMQFGDESYVTEIDDCVLNVVASNGLDCTGLVEALAAGEENEMTVLYHIYLRQKQAERMNYMLRMLNLKKSMSRDLGQSRRSGANARARGSVCTAAKTTRDRAQRWRAFGAQRMRRSLRPGSPRGTSRS